MLYEEARVYLDGVSKYGSVLGLDSIKKLLEELENPQKELKFIHIAGTNGKGSILAYLSTILKEAGYRTGRYISPTVMEYLERFQINGEYMEEAEFAEITCDVKCAAERLEKKGLPYPTAFEIETAIAFLYFKRKKCDFVVLECGLGGALDATNVIESPVLCVFASISMDHIGVLGNTLEEIAEDKAGIIKKGAGVVTSFQRGSVWRILESRAREKKDEIVMAEPEKIVVHKTGMDGQSFSYKEFENIGIHLAGRNQIENAVTALEAVRLMRKKGISVNDAAVYRGMAEARWPGRFMMVSGNPPVIVDGAHNEDAAKRLAQNVDEYLKNKKITAVVGVFRDKEYEKIVDIMAPYLDRAYTIDLPNRERTLEKEILRKVLEQKGIKAETADSIKEALEKAKEQTEKDGAILVFGSLSYLGEVIRLENALRKEDGIKW